MRMTEDETRSAIFRAGWGDKELAYNSWLSLFLSGTEHVAVPECCDAWYCRRRPAVYHQEHGWLCREHLKDMTIYTVPTLNQFNETN